MISFVKPFEAKVNCACGKTVTLDSVNYGYCDDCGEMVYLKVVTA